MMKYMKLKLIIGLSFALALVFFAMSATAQNQDANPYGGIYYNDHSNYRMYGANGLPRTDHANLDTLTNVLKGDLRFDTLNSVVVVYDGTAWVDLVSGGGTLDAAYDYGGAGAGREIDAVDGAVKISGEDGLLVTGTFGSGDTIKYQGVEDASVMYFNPNKAAFRAGSIGEFNTDWDNENVGDISFAAGYATISSGYASFSMGEINTSSGYASTSFGTGTEASGDYSLSTGSSTTSSGNVSMAMGVGSTSKSFAETSIGTFNTDYTPTSTSSWEATDRLFVIGNGQSSGTRSDALIITKEGILTMPTTTGAFTPPILTTTERNALTATEGMTIFNTTTKKHQGYDGTTWNDMY